MKFNSSKMIINHFNNQILSCNKNLLELIKKLINKLWNHFLLKLLIIVCKLISNENRVKLEKSHLSIRVRLTPNASKFNKMITMMIKVERKWSMKVVHKRALSRSKTSLFYTNKMKSIKIHHNKHKQLKRSNLVLLKWI